MSDRSAIVQASAVSLRGRSASLAPSRRSSSRAPSKVRSSRYVSNASISEETQARRSKSRVRSKSTRSTSTRRVEPADASTLIPLYTQNEDYSEEERDTSSRRRSASQARKTRGSSRKFVVEIDEETNDIIGVKEISDDEPPLSSGSGGSERSREGRGHGVDNRRSTRARSRSILRHSHGSSLTSQGERVKFALEDEAPLDNSRKSASEEDWGSPKFEVESGHGMQNNRRPSQTRTLSKQHINFNDVDFDPRGKKSAQAHDNLMELLKRPDRPYEQCQSRRKDSISQSNNTEDTTLTIEEEESDDDSFGDSRTRNPMKHLINQHMEDVAEEENEVTILSECESYPDQGYAPRPRNQHARQDPLRHSMPAVSSSFKNKLKPVRSFNIRAKRQTTPLSGSRESMSTDDEYGKCHLFVNRAADSLMLHQKSQHYQEDQPRGKTKSRLSRFLHR